MLVVGWPRQRSEGFVLDKKGVEEGSRRFAGIRGPFFRGLRADMISERTLVMTSTLEMVATLWEMAVKESCDRHLGAESSGSWLIAGGVRWLRKLPSANEEILTWVEREGTSPSLG